MAVTTKKTFSAASGSTATFGPIGIELNNQDDLDVYITLSGSNDRILQLKQSTASTADSNHPQVNDTTGLYFPAVASGTSLTNYTISADNNNIIFNSNLPSGAIVTCERRTRDGSGDYTSFSGGSTIRSTDLNTAFDELRFTAQEARNKAFALENSYDHYGTGDVSVNAGKTIIFEGATEDDYETELTAVDPTADRTITLPNTTGTLITTGDTNTVTSAMITDGTIVDADINASAAIAQTKVALDADLTALSNCQTGTAAALAALTEAEVQILDGATVTTNELNILDGVTATKDEINILDGVTATKDEINYVDGVTSNVQTQLDAKQASDAELTELATMHTDTASALADLTQAEVQILDGATVTTAELNILDGVTADKDDINIVTNMTKQTTISDQDTSYPTSGAVVDYVAGQLEPFGGFELAANRTSFPNTQPVAGVVISITDASGVVFDSTSTPDTTTGNCKTVGATNVTVQAAPDALQGKTIGAGVGMLVSSTGSGQNYTFHRLLAKDADVEQLSEDIEDFQSRYRVADNEGALTGSDDEGDLYFDKGTNKMYVYDGSSWGEVTSTGDFKYLVPCVFNSGTGNAAVFNGSISKYDLRENTTSGSLASITSAAQLMVSVNGVVQKPNTGTSIGSNDGFCLVDGHTIEFGANLPSSSEVFVIQSGSALSINTPGDNTVTGAKIAMGSDAQGDVLYYNGTDYARLAPGTSGQFLKTQGSSANPVWGDVPAGVGGATGVDFNNSIVARWGDGYDVQISHQGILMEDGVMIKLGTDSDFLIHYDETTSDKALFQGEGKFINGAASKTFIDWDDGDGVDIYFNNSKKFETTNTGVTVTGTVAATSYTGDGSSLTGISSTVLDGCGYQNDQTISAGTYTIAANKGVHSVGPITVEGTVTVNGNWVVS